MKHMYHQLITSGKVMREKTEKNFETPLQQLHRADTQET